MLRAERGVVYFELVALGFSLCSVFGLPAMTAHRIGFLIWPSTQALTLALAEEALRVAQRVHPEVVYELSFLQAEVPGEKPVDHVGQAALTDRSDQAPVGDRSEARLVKIALVIFERDGSA